MVSYILRDLPVGINATGTRRERDGSSSIDVPADRYWGAGTQRALRASPASPDRIPERFYRCYGYVKRAAAVVNAHTGRLPPWKTAAIVRAADDLIAGLLADQFPLPIWQSGSGQEADANVNEVLANRAAQLLGGTIGRREPVDPTRDVNMGQSLGGAFTTSMHIATVMEIEEALVPRGTALAGAFDRNGGAWANHGSRLRVALERLDEAEGGLHEIITDHDDEGTMPGVTGEDWRIFAGVIAADTGRPFIVGHDRSPNRGSLDAIVAAMAAVRGVALALLGIADAIHIGHDDSQWLRNLAPVQAMTMVCMQVIGQDQVVAASACRGNLAPRSVRPLIIGSVLNAIRGLAEACEALRRAIPRTR